MTRWIAIAALIFLGAALVSCSAPAPAPKIVTHVKIERVTVPPSLLVCSPAPTVPQINVTNRMLAAYIVRLWNAYFDCASKLGAIKRIEDAPTRNAAAQKPLR
jgi:hypothetical protein